ncbi:DICT sensory domain-containing protein [Acaryochloris sp. IP29b_bin.137]|uniref:DICT sensory domain-containing protein n=1 Tax=Acaryochloris sp. IP29b_bin.137 TaxID=2969217 RepID=UPI002616CE33|nr:DICT sensory domain-containing protein [Acaryochloris sp. IP29b_bin.137]
MIIATSLIQELLEAQSQLRPQMYFKSSLTALSRAMEDQVLAGTDHPLVIISCQRERYYRKALHRYARLAERSPQVYILATPEQDFKNSSDPYETIAFEEDDPLTEEWHVVVVGQQYAACLACREHLPPVTSATLQTPHMDQARRYEGIWTFDRRVSCQAAYLFLKRICRYRPPLKSKVASALAQIVPYVASSVREADPGPFANRLVTYLQASQYRQQKAYRQIATQARKERLVNSITAAIRRSLDPDHVLGVAVKELGQALDAARCLIYRCRAQDHTAQIQYEFVSPGQPSVVDQLWPLGQNPWFQDVIQTQQWVYVSNAMADQRLQHSAFLHAWVQKAHLQAMLLVPMWYQGRLLGMVELHHSGAEGEIVWKEAEISLVDAIATQIGIALIQAQSFADLGILNQQLADLEQARSNLIAITGHELRTPLSTIQICLESLTSEPDMAPDLQQTMLSTALTDAERMRRLIQDFLTLSRLESGRVEWNSEPLSLRECIDLALSNINAQQFNQDLPTIEVLIPDDLPLAQVDGEWLVEVLAKLLDNACKFTDPGGTIRIQATVARKNMLKVTITDTGRGIEPECLSAVFERFYQEEGALRRTTGGTGLGLAICRQIIQNLGGDIWAESGGKNQGTTIHFTIRSIEVPKPPQSATPQQQVANQR